MDGLEYPLRNALHSEFLCFSAILVGSSGLGECAIEYAPVGPENVRLEVRDGAPLLPFQAIRLRGALQNISGDAFGPVQSIEGSSVWSPVSGPSDRPYSQLRTGVYVGDPERVLVVGLAMNRKARTVPILLAETEALRTSQPLAIVSNDEERYMQHPPMHPLFIDVGEYTIRISYGAYDDPILQSSVIVEVREPQGNDAKICAQLGADEKLAVVVASPVH